MDEVTQQNAALVEQSAAATGWLVDQESLKGARRFPKKLTLILASPEAAVNTQIAPGGDEGV
jgi:methyl-accepting chemotaxis protein